MVTNISKNQLIHYVRSLPFFGSAVQISLKCTLWSWETGSSASNRAVCLSTFRITYKHKKRTSKNCALLACVAWRFCRANYWEAKPRLPPPWSICAPDQNHHATLAMHCKRALELHVSAAELEKLTLFSKWFKAGKTSEPTKNTFICCNLIISNFRRLQTMRKAWRARIFIIILLCVITRNIHQQLLAET